MIVSLWLIHAINVCYQVCNRLRQQDDEFIQMLVVWQKESYFLCVGSYFLSHSFVGFKKYLTVGNHSQETNKTEQASSLAQFFVAIREYR